MRSNISNKLILAVLTVGVLFTACKNGTQVSAPADESTEQVVNVIEDQYIVVFDQAKAKIRLGNVDQVREYRDQVLMENSINNENLLQEYNTVLAGFAAKLSANELESLENDPRVKYIEKDRIVQFAPPCGTPNGGPCDGGGGSNAQETPYGITRVNGATSYTGSNVAWVIDSGIDLDHEDLNVDASRGFNAFTSGKDGKSLDDGAGHGTHVAGTIAAIDNDLGVIGVAPGATVIPVKVLNSRGSGSYSGVIAGVEHVGANGSNGDVANMSLGGPVSQALDDAVYAASQNGIKFTLAAGNESTDANNSSPARVNGNNIYTISAMDDNDDWAYFSNYSNPPVDYAAPGVSIYSTYKNGGYATLNGTSMAAPHAAGVLLLGNASTDGTVNGDPDGNADPIIVH